MAVKDMIRKAVLTATIAGAGAIAAIAGREGFRDTTYLDTGGVPTICFGHTGKDVKMGHKASETECSTLLAKDADEAAQGVRKAVKIDLSQGEFDAYTSFVYNVGIGAFQGSTMLKLVNAGKRTEACKEFPKWVYGRDKLGSKIVLKGLVTDRNLGMNMCLFGVQSGKLDVHRIN